MFKRQSQVWSLAPLVLLLLTCFLPQSEGIQCLECSGKGNLCNDANPPQSVDCAEDYDACTIVSLNFGNGTANIFRHCCNRQTERNECTVEQYPLKGSTRISCTCIYDGCNTSAEELYAERDNDDEGH